MPCDTNANGDIFGGWVLSRMDQACGIAAAEKANGRVVTVAIEAMKFIRPVKVGDVLCVYTAIGHVGRTSVQIHVEAWARRFHSHHREKVTEATFTFVAVRIKDMVKSNWQGLRLVLGRRLQPRSLRPAQAGLTSRLPRALTEIG